MKKSQGKYIRPDTAFPSYYQFPNFLIRLPVSQTAKLTYMVLYDRARLSQKNEWIDEDGRVYTVYPIADLARVLERSQSTIKSALNELDGAGLLIRKSGGFSKANILYVLIPMEGQISEQMKKHPSVGRENSTYEGQKTEPSKGRKLATNKVIDTNNKNHKKGVRLGFKDYSFEEGESF